MPAARGEGGAAGGGQTRRGIGVVLGRRDFLLLCLSQVTGVLGEGAALVALNILVYERTHSAAAVGMLNLYRLLPYIGITAVSGALSDRFDRRRLMVSVDALQALLCAAIVITHSMPVIYLLWALASVMSAVFRPAVQAAVPAITGDDYVAGLSVMRLIIDLGHVAGPGLAAFAIHRFGATAVFASNVVALVLSAALIAATRIPAPSTAKARAAATVAGSAALRAFADDVRQGLAWLRHSRGLVYAFGNMLIAGLPGAFLVAGTVAYVDSALHADESLYGWMTAARALGCAAGFLLVARLGDRMGGRGYFAAVAVQAAGIVAFALGLPLRVLLLLLVLLGVGDGMQRVLTSKFIVAGAPEELRGRLFGLEISVAHLGWMIAYPLVGMLLDGLGMRRGTEVIGLCGIALVLGFTAATRGISALQRLSSAATEHVVDEQASPTG